MTAGRICHSHLSSSSSLFFPSHPSPVHVRQHALAHRAHRPRPSHPDFASCLVLKHFSDPPRRLELFGEYAGDFGWQARASSSVTIHTFLVRSHRKSLGEEKFWWLSRREGESRQDAQHLFINLISKIKSTIGTCLTIVTLTGSLTY